MSKFACHRPSIDVDETLLALRMNIPVSFQDSYAKFDTYPCNLISKTTYSGSLKGYSDRLETLASRLCTRKEPTDTYKSNTVHVAFRDFEFARPPGEGRFSTVNPHTESSKLKFTVVSKQNVVSDSTLKSWLGDRTITNAVTPGQNVIVATKRDPLCRFM